MSKRLTRKQAIDAFCKECIYDPKGGNGTWREQVTNCTAHKCPLYEWRPVSSKENARVSQLEPTKEPEGLRRYREAQNGG